MINDYASLRATAYAWLWDKSVTANLPHFIELAEFYLQDRIKIRGWEVRKTATLSAEYLALPTDFIEMRNIQLNENPLIVLKPKTALQMDEEYPTSETGTPEAFTIIGSELQIKPVADRGYTVEMAYVAKLTALSDSNPTNWLITNRPNIYLYATLREAAIALNDPTRIETYQRLCNGLIDELHAADARAKHPFPPELTSEVSLLTRRYI